MIMFRANLEAHLQDSWLFVIYFLIRLRLDLLSETMYQRVRRQTRFVELLLHDTHVLVRFFSLEQHELSVVPKAPQLCQVNVHLYQARHRVGCESWIFVTSIDYIRYLALQMFKLMLCLHNLGAKEDWCAFSMLCTNRILEDNIIVTEIFDIIGLVAFIIESSNADKLTLGETLAHLDLDGVRWSFHGMRNNCCLLAHVETLGCSVHMQDHVGKSHPHTINFHCKRVRILLYLQLTK
mmetsp:Transcript_27254/g.42369  ORF Transcript_27254/g.42369 Transcript_27254/m.42369 type:complete len:237 (-) Transcript_27254:3466-4176(-)